MGEVWGRFKTIIQEAMNKFVPQRKQKRNFDPEYYTSNILLLKRRVRLAYNNRKVSANYHKHFLILAKRLEKENKLAEENFLKNVLKEGQNNWGKL